MKKLDFLVGKWSGDASVSRGAGQAVKGRNMSGEMAYQALATISYDDATSTYHFRAYNDGRYLDTELSAMPKGFAWGFPAGLTN